MELLCIALICLAISQFCLFVIVLNKKDDSKKKINFNDLPVDISRQQRRLFEKQLIDFKSKFSSFSNYQLNVISELCLDLVYERMKKNETREK